MSQIIHQESGCNSVAKVRKSRIAAEDVAGTGNEVVASGRVIGSAAEYPVHRSARGHNALRENNCRLSLRERAIFRGKKGDDQTACSRAEPDLKGPAELEWEFLIKWGLLKSPMRWFHPPHSPA